MEKDKLDILKKTIWLRLAQIAINNICKKGEFSVPVHLAMGHESIAVAVDEAMGVHDSLFLTHRNMHYNLARMDSLKLALDEYYLKETGLGGGSLGSMNLSNPEKGIIYTSSILGNNLSVGSGYALGNKVINENGVVFIVTGDGAIEEGSFYESILFLKSNCLPSVIIVENNNWSLATKINERRANIDLNILAKSIGLEYISLSGNDPFEYINTIQSVRSKSLAVKSPVLVEVELTTLGYWYLKNEENPTGKFINYHAGPAPQVVDSKYPIIESSEGDPLAVLRNHLDINQLTSISEDLLMQINKEIS
jgi:TPP-dependent pyruvate/acetoin dehydrogenase alpha subunit